MAHMFPTHVKWEPSQSGERRFFEACRLHLDNEYLVFHSVQWQYLDNDNRPQDAEADFIVAHPKKGILVLEVKGGTRITFEPRTGQWYSTSGSGDVFKIKDPTKQAVRGKHLLKRQLETMLPPTDHSFNIGHAVVFPSVMSPLDFSIRPDMPPDIVIDSVGLQHLSQTLDAIFAYYRGDYSPESVEPSRAAIQQLRLLLGKTVELRPAMWGDFVDEQSEMLRLTQEQYQLLESLQLHNRALIWGCAGSGKTLIAAEKAARLSQQGFRVLLTCFNKGLAAFLRERLAPYTSKPGVTLDIENFHDLCEHLAAKARIPLNNQDNVTYFGEELPMALMEASDILDVRYDVLVVDEGQDFQDNWWAGLQYLLQHPEESIFYIFYDEQQRIYPNTGNFPMKLQPYLLTRNCRNTRSIHRLMTKFYSGQLQITAQGPVGRPVEVIPIKSSASLAPKLSGLLHDLTTTGRIPYSEIVVLTPSRAHTTLWAQPLPGPISLTDHWPPEPGCVYCTTVHAFKGLEASVVVLVELDLWPTDRVSLDAVLYVASSRARNHLVVFLPDATTAKVRAKFA